jgi:ribosome-interacting GTPase 1
MPANLSPQYLEAEQRYRKAKSNPEKMEALEIMLTLIPKHKGTEKLQAQIKKRISKLKEASGKKKAISREAELSHIKREGAAQLALSGLPNVGKSSILAKLSSASPEIAPYPFTTRLPMPGMVMFENIQFQLIDLPPLSQEFTEPWVFALMKQSDLLLIVIDLNEDPAEQMAATLAILKSIKILPLEIGSASQEMQAIQGEKFHVKKSLIVANKNDVDIAEISMEYLKEQYQGRFPMLAVSTKQGDLLEDLKKNIFTLLEIIRIYSKLPGKDPNFSAPFILKKGSTIRDIARLVHKDFVDRLKFARIWGKETFQGQRVHQDFIVHDGDVVELHM